MITQFKIFENRQEYREGDYILYKNNIYKLTGEKNYIGVMDEIVMYAAFSSGGRKEYILHDAIDRTATTEEIINYENEKKYDTSKYNI
jgi:hypothetical protein